ncbi:MAG TPA: rhomboid family intramembrane serine protease [Salinivirga sp.]|uniref:rhomboid family intramembrane serine protease n=1 Tax=Salinivirga sp. TaxID=1970192 RepID=UPI002B461CF1|nr:rhomboid family intramembrane serine protease [Salinivirga sp.]HKK58838.1 rhomboid family intramembrane serine protease [Salinivirga sp.]
MTLFIIVITAVVSVYAFQRPEIMYRYNFSPYQVIKRKEYYRLFSHALLHVDWMHLIINMLVLYSFANVLIFFFNHYFAFMPAGLLFLIFYVLAILASSLVSLFKQKDNYSYSAVGASGAVSAVVFACIFFAPLEKVLFFGVLPIPGIVFGIAYLAYSYYMGKKNVDNIGHDAHFWGAIFGFLFPLVLEPRLINVFLNQLLNW